MKQLLQQKINIYFPTLRYTVQRNVVCVKAFAMTEYISSLFTEDIFTIDFKVHQQRLHKLPHLKFPTTFQQRVKQIIEIQVLPFDQ